MLATAKVSEATAFQPANERPENLQGASEQLTTLLVFEKSISSLKIALISAPAEHPTGPIHHFHSTPAW